MKPPTRPANPANQQVCVELISPHIQQITWQGSGTTLPLPKGIQQHTQDQPRLLCDPSWQHQTAMSIPASHTRAGHVPATTSKPTMSPTQAALGPQQPRPCTPTAHEPHQPIHHATRIHLQAIHSALSRWLSCTTHSFTQFPAQSIPWSCLGMVDSMDARHTQAATHTAMSWP